MCVCVCVYMCIYVCVYVYIYIYRVNLVCLLGGFGPGLALVRPVHARGAALAHHQVHGAGRRHWILAASALITYHSGHRGFIR